MVYLTHSNLYLVPYFPSALVNRIWIQLPAANFRFPVPSGNRLCHLAVAYMHSRFGVNQTGSRMSLCLTLTYVLLVTPRVLCMLQWCWNHGTAMSGCGLRDVLRGRYIIMHTRDSDQCSGWNVLRKIVVLKLKHNHSFSVEYKHIQFPRWFRMHLDIQFVHATSSCRYT